MADIYFEQAQRLPDSTWVTAPLYPQVVVVSDRNGVKDPTAYLAFYFADWNSESFLEENPGEGMLNSLPKGTFSGRIIYTDLQGHPLAAARYRQGELEDRASLGDATDSLSLVNESRRLNQLAEGLLVCSEEGRTFVLIEELIHIHQMQNAGDQFGRAKLNYEIEAKLGWLMYELRTNVGVQSSSYDAQLGGNGTKSFYNIAGIYSAFDRSNPKHMDYYDEVVVSLRMLRGYSDENKYPEMEDSRKFENLIELMKNCLGL